MGFMANTDIHPERKSGVMLSNKRAINKYGKDTLASAKVVASSIDGYVSTAVDIHDQLANKAEEILASENDALTTNLEEIAKRSDTNRQLLTRVRNDDDAETKIFDILQQDIQNAHSTFEAQLTSWKSTVQDALQISCGQIGTAVKKHNVVVEQSVDALQAALNDIVLKARQYLQEQQEILTEMKENADNHTDYELSRLRKENAWLNSLVDKERQQAQASKDGLIARISDLLGDFLNERDASLRQAVGGLQQSHDAQMDVAKTYHQQQDGRLGNVGEKSKAFESSLQTASREGKRKREAVGEVRSPLSIPSKYPCADGLIQVVRSTQQVLSTSLGELQGTSSQKMDGLYTNVQTHQRNVTNAFSSST